jgi:hypothetical protein
MKRIAVVLSLAVAFCFVLASVAQSTDTATGQQWARKNLKNKKKAVSIPVWQITQDGTNKSVTWVDHAPNPRFAVYDPGTPSDDTDDLVLDKQTGLVWVRAPEEWTDTDWATQMYRADTYARAGIYAWKLPSLQEFLTLFVHDVSTGYMQLPTGHPFLIDSPTYPGNNHGYWTSTCTPGDNSYAYSVYHIMDVDPPNLVYWGIFTHPLDSFKDFSFPVRGAR